ncbi:MAG: ROK family protein [Bacillota bacterium]
MDKKTNIIKDINLNKVRNALKGMEAATKPQLAKKTELSVVTINSLVNTLIEDGEIIPHATLESEGGRPAATFVYNNKFRLALVIYMLEYHGEDTAFYCVVDLCGQVIEKIEQKLVNISIGSFDDNIEKLVNKYPQIKVICFGVPGGEVNQCLVISDYENLRGKSLSGYIHEKHHLPVLVENDINAAVVGYSHRNNIDASQCVIGLYFPEKYPPGAGIYLNGNIFKGRNGLAGEIKYLPFGIHWDSFDYNTKEVDDFIVKTIQAFQCTFNPNVIVLYGEKTGNYAQRIHEKCDTSVAKMMIPEIVASGDLNEDFETGIKLIALKMIEN